MTAYKTHGWIRCTPISAGQIKKRTKLSTNIKRHEIDIMNIINDNTYNLHSWLVNNNNVYMKITLKSKQIGIDR